MRLAMAVLILSGITPLQAQWIAYNDHASGPGTHPNATRYNMLDAEDGTNGFLRNIATGEPLPVTLTLARTGTVAPDPLGGEPAAGTPLAIGFNGVVDFSGSAHANNVGLGVNGEVLYEFAGLNPARPYNIQAGAVRGGNFLFTNRWSLVELIGADYYTNAHSPGILTTALEPSLADNQAACNTGLNHTAGIGFSSRKRALRTRSPMTATLRRSAISRSFR
jgi:hypothetical protein